jgi:predicted dehydrogenase
MNQKLKWGIIGLGWIAEHFANGLRGCRTGELVAVASRSLDKARKFAARHGGARAHGSYEDLVNDPGVQIVYVATPHTMHAEWSVRAAEAGKHVLCEKPLAMNHTEATALMNAVRPLNVFFMEAFMYRIHPQTLKLIELLRQRAIGDVCMIQSTHSFRAKYDPAHRLFDKDLGGGAILDVGCYDVSVSRLIAGVAGVAGGGELAEPTTWRAARTWTSTAWTIGRPGR